MPKKFLSLVLLVFIFSVSLFLFVTPTHSDQLDDLNKQISDLTKSLNDSVAATKPLESQLTSLQNQVAGIRSQISTISDDLVVKKKQIDDGYTHLASQEALLNHTIRDYYIKSSYNTPFLIFLSARSASQMTQMLAYERATTDRDKTLITEVALTITDLEKKRIDLNNQVQELASAKVNLDAQSTKLDSVIKGAQAYQAQVSTQIASLTSQQQQLLAQKYASLNIPQTAYTAQGGCSSDISVDPGFSPRFAAFSFGVPNRVGMNQYGAKGRAAAGQSFTDILNAYYQNIQITTVSTSTTMTVNGTNDYGESFSNQQMNIEDYVKHVYEMPTSWPAEALKAQAIAARSYALATTNNGSSPICADQHCQEVKTEQNTDAWVQAVNATAGQVMTSGGQPIKAWFSSTHGGYEFSSSDIGWSSTPYTKEMYDGTGTVNSFADLQANAYDKDSPWFYCDWGSRSQYHSTAWLQSGELADIVNVVSLANKDSSTIQHLSQSDKPNPDGTDTWSSDRVKQEASSRSLPAFSSISSVSVNWDKGSGRVTTISFSGDAGTVSFDGSTFKNFFNLRAPANIQIVGPLFNIEQK